MLGQSEIEKIDLAFPAAGVVCFKRLLNQSVRKSLKTYKPTILGKERIANEKKRENHAIV